jgi:hypothetical protein
VVYLSEREQTIDYVNIPVLLDPELLRAARRIYRTYSEVHPKRTQRPIGVAIDRYSYRGYLIFNDKPILLYREDFVPLNQLESEMY